MAGPDDAPDATQWRRTSKFYRRVPGLPARHEGAYL